MAICFNVLPHARVIRISIVFSVLAIAACKARVPDGPMNTAVITSSLNGCQFAFQVSRDAWVADQITDSNGLIPSGTTTRPAFFLNGTRYWSGDEDKGGWSTPIERSCIVEKRGAQVTEGGPTVLLFLATACKPGGNWYPDRSTENFIYGYIARGNEADIIWIASDDKAALLAREGEIRAVIRSYATKAADCVEGQRSQK